MSASSKPSTSNVFSNETEHRLVPAENLQSAILSHHEKTATLVMVPRGDKGPEWQAELQRARDDFDNDRITWAECSAVVDRVLAALDAERKRVRDFKARERAGKAKPSDLVVAVYGCTEEEAEKFVEEGARSLDTRLANEARARTRVLQSGGHGHGH